MTQGYVNYDIGGMQIGKIIVRGMVKFLKVGSGYADEKG